MRYYSTWQEALMDYLSQFGENYDNVYNLMEEFEQKLNRNSKGTYFMYIKRSII